MHTSPYDTLCDRLGEVIDLRAAVALLQWDQEVCMPPKGAAARGRQLATLSALEHRLATSGEIGALLMALEGSPEARDVDAAKLVAEAHYDYARARRLPEVFVERFAAEQSKAYQAWVKAREESNFKTFQPHLETLLELLRQKADYLGYEGSPYNALIEDYERGMTTEQLRVIFGELAQRQSALVDRIVQAPQQPQLGWLQGEWGEEAQWALTL